MTWTIDPSEQLFTDDALSDAVARFFDAFTETLDTDLLQRFLHFVELERLDDRLDFFHFAAGLRIPLLSRLYFLACALA